MKLDIYLLDRLAQPMADRLGVWWVPRTLGRTVFLAGTAVVAADEAARLLTSPAGTVDGWALEGLLCVPGIIWIVLTEMARAERQDRGCANSLRLRFWWLRLLWLGQSAVDGLGIVAVGHRQVPAILGAALICAGLYLASCQIRPPRLASSRVPPIAVRTS